MPNPNLLLESLPVELRNSLLSRMEPVQLPLRTTIYQPDEVPKFAHFITSGITSIVTFMQSGDGVEVGLLGNESVVEVFHLLGNAAIGNSGFVQIEGTALRMPFAELRRQFAASEILHTRVLQAVQSQSLILSQLAACNRLHEVEERLAR